MAVTIKDIAHLANTSTATVSRVLSNKPGVAEERRRLIVELAEKMGYRPNRIARNLALQKSFVLGFIAADLCNPVYIDLLHLIQKALEDEGYNILVADSERDVEKEKYNISMMREHRADGLIIFPVHDWDVSSDIDHLLQLRLDKMPFVLVGKVAGYGFDCVTNEEVNTAQRLTRQLLDLGHRRFAFVGHVANNRCSMERLEGVKEALHQQGVALGKGQVILAEEGWPSQLKALLSSPDRPTALIAVSDQLALESYRPIKDLGLEMPRDLSVAAFGDAIWSEYLTPSLTATATDNQQLAERAIQLLFSRLDGTQPNGSPQSLEIPQRLVLRESIGPCSRPTADRETHATTG